MLWRAAVLRTHLRSFFSHSQKSQFHNVFLLQLNAFLPKVYEIYDQGEITSCLKYCGI